MTTKKKRTRKVLPDGYKAPTVLDGKTVNHDRGGRFVAGNSAAKGRGGSQSRTAIQKAVMAAMTEKEEHLIIRKAVVAAKRNDAAARQWLFDRRGGRARLESEYVTTALDLPKLRTAKDCAKATSKIIRATAGGELSFEQAERALKLIGEARDAVAVAEIEADVKQLQRLRKMEQRT